MSRRTRTRATVLTVVLLALMALAGPAAAHPLGNATVNHYDGLHLYQDRLVDTAVEDIAEIPTFQRHRDIDTDGNGTLSLAERTAYAARRCAALVAGVSVRVADQPVPLRVTRSGYDERPGAIGLKAGRLECDLEAPLSGSLALDHATTLQIADTFDGEGIGWHEITAEGTGVVLHGSPFPARSISDELRRYPGDLLSSPLDVRDGSVRLEPGAGDSTYALARRLPVAGPAVQALNALASTFNHTVGAQHLTLGVGLLALLLSLALGAGHAFLPGHGKTVMAAYLVGRRGRLRDVVTVGATVTLTHTAGVLLLGLAITTTSSFAPTQAEQYLGVLSGLIVAGVGLGLLVSALRRRRGPLLSNALAVPANVPVAPALQPVGGGSTQAATTDTHPDHHPHHHEHAHGDEHGHTHRGGHSHSHLPSGHGFSRSGLIGLGVAGGLVPSPSALLVLLAATALGRTAFGILLVLGYGAGMALALSVAGLLLVKVRGRLDRFAGSLARADRLLAALPVLTSLLVLAVGLGLALRALGGTV